MDAPVKVAILAFRRCWREYPAASRTSPSTFEKVQRIEEWVCVFIDTSRSMTLSRRVALADWTSQILHHYASPQLFIYFDTRYFPIASKSFPVRLDCLSTDPNSVSLWVSIDLPTPRRKSCNLIQFETFKSRERFPFVEVPDKRFILAHLLSPNRLREWKKMKEPFPSQILGRLFLLSHLALTMIRPTFLL
jgi:hypothetical protein